MTAPKIVYRQEHQVTTCYNSAKRPKFLSFFAFRIRFTQHAQMNMAFTVEIMTNF